jgi:polar amino acid transport system ATP-binding protein
MGSSGSGKSTLMNTLGCLDRPTSGLYRLAGQEVGLLNPAERAKIRNKNIGFVFQSFHLLSRTSALENVELPLQYQGVPRSERKKRATESLRLVGLGDRVEHHPNQLSGGQQQRVAIARAMLTRPRALLLDEVTSALDPELVGEVLELIRELKLGGMTMILATHEMSFARDVADQVCFLEGGRIIEQGPPEQILSAPSEPATQRFLRRLIDAHRL